MKRGHPSTRPIGTLEPPSISTQNEGTLTHLLDHEGTLTHLLQAHTSNLRNKQLRLYLKDDGKFTIKDSDLTNQSCLTEENMHQC